MIMEDLSKSYLVKQLQGNRDKTYHIEQTQGKYPGAKINFTARLLEHTLANQSHKMLALK